MFYSTKFFDQCPEVFTKAKINEWFLIEECDASQSFHHVAEEDRMEYWMTGNRRDENYKATADAAPYLCEDCNKHDASEDWNTHKDNRSHCVNCNFNFWCVQSGTPTIQQERESIQRKGKA